MPVGAHFSHAKALAATGVWDEVYYFDALLLNQIKEIKNGAKVNVLCVIPSAV